MLNFTVESYNSTFPETFDIFSSEDFNCTICKHFSKHVAFVYEILKVIDEMPDAVILDNGHNCTSVYKF